MQLVIDKVPQTGGNWCPVLEKKKLGTKSEKLRMENSIQGKKKKATKLVGFLSPELVLTGVSHPVLYYCASYASSLLNVCSYSFIMKSKYFQNIKPCELIPSFMFCLLFHQLCPWSLLQALLELAPGASIQVSGYLCAGSFSVFRRGFNPSRELSSNSFS